MSQAAVSRRIIVSGAGIGGLVAAVALTKLGFSVKVYGDPLSSSGFLAQVPHRRAAISWGDVDMAIPLWGSALRALDRLGVTKDLHTLGLPTHAFKLFDSSGRLLHRFDLSAQNRDLPDMICVHRSDLVESLTRALPKGVIARDGAQVTGFLNQHMMALFGPEELTNASPVGVIQNAHPSMIPTALYGHVWERQGVAVRVQKEHGEPYWRTCDALAGADGVRSKIRAHLWPHADPPRFAKYNVWRGVTSARAFAADFPVFEAREIWGTDTRFGCMRIDHERLYWYAQHFSREPVSPDASFQDKVATLLAAVQGFAFHCASIVRSTPPASLIAHPGRQWGSPWTDPSQYADMRLYHDSRIVLLGSAAHPEVHCSCLGQEAGTAVEDAYGLAKVLSSSGLPLSFALRRFEMARMNRAEDVGTDTQRLGKLVCQSGWMPPFIRDLDLRKYTVRKRVNSFLQKLAYDPVNAQL